MAKPNTKNLKLYVEQLPEVVRPAIESVGSLPAVLRSFQATTGWSLRYLPGEESHESGNLSWSAPVGPGVGVPPGHLRLDPLDDPAKKSRRPIAPDTARAMAAALADMLGEFMETRRALWQREAELAAGVPLVPHEDEGKHLAARLEAVLRGGAEAVDCHAAALYLLDEATTQLKLRSSWGLPFDRLTVPARPLGGALADLEALLGHAVVLEDPDMMRHWKTPEDFPAAVCVPVSTPTTLLGTLWVFSDNQRDFTDSQTNMLEVVAGRLAADLEREMLMREGVDGAQSKKEIAEVDRMQRGQLPSISPLLDGWALSGWTEQAQSVGGDFYDWFCPGDGLLAVAVGHAMEKGLPAAMAAGALKSALRAHAQYHREAQTVLKQLNLTLWTGSAGDQHASLVLGLVEPASGRMSFVTAGRPGMLVVRADGWEPLDQASARLGESPESDYEPSGYEVQPGEALVLVSEGVLDAADSEGRRLGPSGVAESLAGHLDLGADRSAALVREKLAAHAPSGGRSDRTVLVVKRI